MKDLASVQTWELQAYLEATRIEIATCEAALQGNKGSGAFQERLVVSKHLVSDIEAELKRRE